MRLFTAVACAWALLAVPAAAQQPLGIVDMQFARLDPDTLAPAGPVIESAETHTRPVLSPDGARFALGVSESGSGGGRTGLWVGEAAQPRITHRVATGIAAEAVVFPGVVGALLQDGRLVVVDPETGAITRSRQVGWSSCAREGVLAAGRGVIVNEVRADGAEVAIVDARGRISTRFVRLRPSARRCVALVADGERAYIVGRDRVAALDPATRAVTMHAVRGRPTTAVSVPQGLVVAGAGGARLYETRTWRTVWHDRRARSVLASGDTVVATGDGVRALDAATGRVLWRAEGTAAAVAAGRVYAQPAVLDLVTGEQVGTHPMPNTRIRLVDVPQGAAAAGRGKTPRAAPAARRRDAASARDDVAQAAWPYERVTDITDREIFALQGDTILTAGTELREHPGRRFALPRGTQVVDLVQATSKALMVFMVGPEFRVRYGPRNGPLRPHRRTYTVTAAITGSTLLTVERDQRWIYKRDIRGGPQRRLARVGRELSYMQVAGNYVAVQTEQRRIVILDVRSGRRIYSVPSGGYYRLSANGRIVFSGDEFERIRTATPRRPEAAHDRARQGRRRLRPGRRRDRLQRAVERLDRKARAAHPRRPPAAADAAHAADRRHGLRRQDARLQGRPLPVQGPAHDRHGNAARGLLPARVGAAALEAVADHLHAHERPVGAGEPLGGVGARRDDLDLDHLLLLVTVGARDVEAGAPVAVEEVVRAPRVVADVLRQLVEVVALDRWSARSGRRTSTAA